ncbi:FAD-dependent oxidoreductase [Kibdelosporangium phytohabitans]|uniref:FAD-binding domain-containing protein n=1 Tax=Kibdelosporangium phytohabitans TaxID=860235 RepID=A0A0N9I312_9PSEU|nr:NAD(P)/FAD-dependent oxidoreductase [Kibdelosporangium phytohabitans]ALG12158.1 hypothetical protein AOZ06_39615 [Kibdelosporangium phytohabitans]MBE1463682.1 2-polyprenyl-6-methoxyphenol hydroxylase-like FAD-dependent oxidoreductase [Kibdelosporangium phytohabitans]
MSFHVVVIGGGTGGLSLAHGLCKAGVSVAVYERQRVRTDRLQGFRLQVNPEGSRSLRECLPDDLWEEFIGYCGEPDGDTVLTDVQLNEIMRVGAPPPAHDNPIGVPRAISRTTLQRLLSSGLDGVVRYDKEFVHYERQSDGRVRCHFADGTTTTADLVVGADGGNSRVREQLLPRAERVNTGIFSTGGKFPLTPETVELLPRRLTEGPNAALASHACGIFTMPFWHSRPDEEDYITWSYSTSASFHPPRSAEMDGEEIKDVVGRLMTGWHPALRRVVAESDPRSAIVLPIYTAKRVRPWRTENVTVLGDAIHSMTPFMGAGANTAIRDAALLTGNLVAVHSGQRELLDAVRDYEAKMLEYGFTMVRASLALANMFVSESWLLRDVVKSTAKALSLIPPLKRKLLTP